MQPQHLWWLIGLALFLAEMGLPGLTLFFFAVGAIVTGFVCWAASDISLTAQIWIFLLVSIGSLVSLRRWMCRVFRGKFMGTDTPGLPDDYIGRRVFVTEAIAPDRPGRVEINGANWTAEADQALGVGARVEIVARKALSLRVQPVENANP